MQKRKTELGNKIIEKSVCTLPTMNPPNIAPDINKSMETLEPETDEGISQNSLHCRFCHKFCFTLSEKEIHERGHTEDKKLKCPIPECSRGFRRNSYLAEHLSAVHRGEKPFVCEYCPMAFSLRCNLKRHIRLHTGEKPFSCQICRETFTLKKNMMEHELLHTGERPHECEWCGLKFSRRSSLVRHARVTHMKDKSFKCEKCNKSFPFRYFLKRHISVHAYENAVAVKRKRRTKAEIAKDKKEKEIISSKEETSFHCLTDNNIFDDQKPIELGQPCMVVLPKLQVPEKKVFDFHEEKDIIVEVPKMSIETALLQTNVPHYRPIALKSENNKLLENSTRQLVVSLPRINLWKI